MLDAAREKQLHEYPRLKAEFKNWDSQQLPVADNTYDTVVDTFGLCSVPDPVKALREMERVAKPGAPIILLQHGRSRHGWLNTALDKTAEDHAQKWGCWWNREITDIVREAGLHVESCDTSLLDTTYLIRARKPLPAAPCSNRAGSGDTDQRDV
ncbi:S-adenosyl-L-methionine-dependent methyltransferase [Caulochytrium protostelioides]|nr:S-adenosyl-L-methionine-dependent methyltransferase [Caulochytrium protostelioides]